MFIDREERQLDFSVNIVSQYCSSSCYYLVNTICLFSILLNRACVLGSEPAPSLPSEPEFLAVCLTSNFLPGRILHGWVWSLVHLCFIISHIWHDMNLSTAKDFMQCMCQFLIRFTHFRHLKGLLHCCFGKHFQCVISWVNTSGIIVSQTPHYS